MTIDLPQPIKAYIEASNAHSPAEVAACFGCDAIIRDEGVDRRGTAAIEAWASTTIEEFRFHITPMTWEAKHGETIVIAKVSGTFDGSPLTLKYHFTCAEDKIVALRIE